MNWSENSKFWKPYYWNKTDLYIHQIKLYRNDFTSYYGFQKFELLEEFNLNWSVLASYALSATKLNVQSRFQPQILYCQSFIHFWPLEVQKFRAHKIEPLLTRIRFSQSYFNLAKNDFYSWYPHRRDKHSMQKTMEKRKIVVIWKFILHFSNRIGNVFNSYQLWVIQSQDFTYQFLLSDILSPVNLFFGVLASRQVIRVLLNKSRPQDFEDFQDFWKIQGWFQLRLFKIEVTRMELEFVTLSRF